MTDRLEHASIRIPCSTSNLGSGFDLIGLALDRHLEVRYEPSSEPLTFVREGTLAELSDDPSDLTMKAFLERLAEDAVEATGILSMSSNIPVGRGLGSSAAATAAGHAVAELALGAELDRSAAFVAAWASEGHGDNAAPSVFGGLRAVVTDGATPRVMELELSPNVGFAYAAPGSAVSTREARRGLPATVPHSTAVQALGRTTALVRGLATADADWLRLGLADEMHVPFRLPLIPGGAEALDAATSAGAWAATISGAGSGLIALGPPERMVDVATAMRDAFVVRAGDDGVVAFVARPDFEGLRVLSAKGDS